MNQPYLQIVFCADDDFAMPLSVALRSLCDNARSVENFEITLLYRTFSEDFKEKIILSLSPHTPTIHWKRIDTLPIPDPTSEPHLTRATSYRFAIPEAFPTSQEYVLYLDADIVVTGAIEDILKEGSREHVLSATIDKGEPTVSGPYGIKRYQELGLPKDMSYFNAGVLLVNLPLWREQSISEKALGYLREHAQEMNLVSQEALNIAVNGDWTELPEKWNQMVSPLLKPPYTPLEPGIVHYFTSYKPWNLDYNHEAKSLYFDYLDRTAWRGTRPSKPGFFHSFFQRLGMRA